MKIDTTSSVSTKRQGFKIVRTNGTSYYGYRWPLPMPGERVRVVADNVDPTNNSPCPSRLGDGLCVALTAAGASSGGISLSSCIGLLLEYDDANVLGRSADKLRVSAVDVVGVFNVLELIGFGMCADLSYANLSGVNLSYADLSGANLYGADLSGADLSYANLSGADLTRAYLSGANLFDADLSRANLSDADLSRANLSDADLSHTDLTHANLSYANLSGADLSDADLSGADLSDANLSGADLSDANLSGAIGLPDNIKEKTS